MKEQFISWLASEKPNSVRHYTSGFNSIEKILSNNNLSPLTSWTLENYEVFFEKLKSFKSFENLNSTGNNILTATLSNYKKFMEQKDDLMIPMLPFDSFGWRWASTGIASHLNRPNSLRAVLDTILINGNGANNYTAEFKELLNSICINKYSFTKDQAEALTKPLKFSNSNEPITIIENSGNYWAHLGLLSTTAKYAEVSELGKRFLTGELPENEFISNLIENYSLPNKAYKITEISKWNAADLKIFPLKLIQNIFLELHKNYPEFEKYLTEQDLARIVIPCSYDLVRFNVKYISKHILEFRKNPDDYSSWPNPQSTYTEDKGFRMANEFLYFLEVFGFLSSNKDSIRGVDKKYFTTDKFIKIKIDDNDNKIVSAPLTQIDFSISSFQEDCKLAGLIYSEQLLTRFISSLATKPFVLLSGLSGSGKTKLAQSFAQWICESEGQYCIVPIGADWINREPLLGYVNALNAKEYVLPENKALELIIKANKDETKPYFLILDEMNLSHVERYFADFLSVMESNDNFKLHSDRNNDKSGVPHEFAWPKNLFVVGTVNIDETTYMFSPKVLDRANVIEFRVDEKDIESFLIERKGITSIAKLGAGMGNSFVEIAKDCTNDNDFTQLNSELLNFFEELQNLGAEFGYRTATEIQTLFSKIDLINPSYSTKINEKIDIAIMQKLLPKLHGSRRKLLKTLHLLAQKCLEKEQNMIFDERGVSKIEEENVIKYILSFEKIARMYKNAIENGFASYAEA